MPDSRATTKATEYNEAVLALTKIIDDDVVQNGDKAGEASAFRVTVAIIPGGVDSVLSLMVTDGSTAFVLPLNSGTALVAGQLYTFTHGTRGGHSYNYQLVDATTIALLYVEEVTSEAL